MRLWWGSKKVKNLRPTFNNQNTKDKAFKTCCASSSHHNYFFVFEFNSNRKNVFSIFSFGKHLNALLGSQVWWWCVHVIFKVQVPFIIGEIKVSWKKPVSKVLKVVESKVKIIPKNRCTWSGASKCMSSVFLCLRWPHHPDSRSKVDLEPLAPPLLSWAELIIVLQLSK